MSTSSVQQAPGNYADVQATFQSAPGTQQGHPTVPSNLQAAYANGAPVYEFNGNGLGGQAGNYKIYDEQHHVRQNLSTSVNGTIGFERDFDANGKNQSKHDLQQKRRTQQDKFLLLKMK